MSDQTPSRWQRPIFVASLGRSGSTLLQRVLNVHPDITIWGEHGGMLKGVTATVRASQDEFVVKNLDTGNELRDAVIGELSDKETFYPWVSPFKAEEFSNELIATTLELFTRGLTPDIRWGFKEIRYDAETLRTLMEMFPEAHLVLLAREVEGHVSSRFFAFGNRDYDLVSEEGRQAARTKVGNMIVGWMRRYEGMLELRDEMPDRCSLVAYSDLVQGNARIPALFAELGETVPDDAALDEVLKAKAGSSFKYNSIARQNRALLPEIIESADYDRDRYAAIASAFGITP